MKIQLIYISLLYFCSGCNNVDQSNCAILKTVYNDFIQKHKNEFKY